MNNKERGESIRNQILIDVRDYPAGLSKHIAKTFSISVQAVNNHIKRLEAEERLTSKGIGKGKRYYPGEKREYKLLSPLVAEFTEDSVWRDHFSFIFEGLPENIIDICQYGFTEMVNNVIDHSGGEHISISAIRDKDKIMMFVIDDGEGIFREIKRLCGLHDER